MEREAKQSFYAITPIRDDVPYVVSIHDLGMAASIL
jgi:hypothetical protein